MNNYIVYCHTNLINNKKYFGITKQSFNKRCGKDGARYLIKTNNKFHQPKFAKAILKYGWDNFTHEILFENLSEIEAKQKEQELISFYKATNSKFGYNITVGGESNSKYSTEEEYLTARKLYIQKGYQKIKEKIKQDPDYKEHLLEVRRNWYKNKIQIEKYHTYVLEKSKLSRLKHKMSLTTEQYEAEKQYYTEHARQNRLEQKNKKEELQTFIKNNLDKLTSTKAQKYIKSIKWYKVQSMSKLLTIENDLKSLKEISHGF